MLWISSMYSFPTAPKKNTNLGLFLMIKSYSLHWYSVKIVRDSICSKITLMCSGILGLVSSSDSVGGLAILVDLRISFLYLLASFVAMGSSQAVLASCDD